MKRIVLVGCGGAGKTTLARALHHITDIPLIHLDKVVLETQLGGAKQGRMGDYRRVRYERRKLDYGWQLRWHYAHQI